jgi:hypothetical protein
MVEDPRIVPDDSELRQLVVQTHQELPYLDGHHKFIRWHFVTHSGIDGYSRMIVHMQCSTNNCASTVLNAFLDGVQRFSVPSRVRSDFGVGKYGSIYAA